jgi:GNAT superfamily N-acetyltransferase
VLRSSAYIESEIAKAREEDDETNTFAGVALFAGEIVGLHLLRRFEEGDRVGVHVAGLWVAESHRRNGVARTLKQLGEAWARSIGASFLNSNVHVKNARMLEINRRLGFEPQRVNLRKRL